MSYAAKEASVAGGAPYFLYEFNTGSGVFRYTDYPTDFQWNSETWVGFPITHTDIKQSDEMSKNSVKVTIPLSGLLADKFIGWAPDEVITLTIRRGHHSETDIRVSWKGRVSAHKLKEQTVELNCESVFTSMRRSGAKARFQRSCRHALYGRGCNVVKEDFAVPGRVDSLSGLTLTIPEATTKPDGWFIGGMIEFKDGSFRMVTGHIGSSITITRSSRYLLESYSSSGYGLNYGEFYGGINVTLYPGCDRTLATCRDKFNNLLNQGGFRWIPSKNPMGGSSIV